MFARPVVISLIAATAVLFTGCGSHPSSGSSSSSSFKVALLTDGPVTDGGWNQSAYEAITSVGKSLGCKVSNEQTDQSQFDSAFTSYAQQGYNVIFAHGDEYQDSAARIAPKFPKTVFITTGGEKVLPNLSPIIFRTEDGTYIQGMQAGMLSKSGIAGFVGGGDYPPVERAANAFGLGMKAVNPKSTFIATYIDSWTDATKAKAQTDALMARGADMVAHNCDAAAQGVFQATAAKPGVYSFGVNSNQNAESPNIISSATLDIPNAFLAVATQVKNGTFKSGPIIRGMKEGDIAVVDNPSLDHLFTTAQLAQIKQAEQGIISGKIDIPTLVKQAP